MMKKVALLAAAAGGYVVGAKAGRQRYEQIRTGAQRIASNPKVREATQRAQHTVTAQAAHAADAARERMPGHGSGGDGVADQVRRQASVQPGP